MVEPGTPSLQQAVTSCTWRIEVTGPDPGEVGGAAVRSALAADQLVVTRARKGHEVTDDLRPLILSLAVTGPTPNGAELVAELATQPRGLRPAELLARPRRREPRGSPRAGAPNPPMDCCTTAPAQEPLALDGDVARRTPEARAS